MSCYESTDFWVSSGPFSNLLLFKIISNKTAIRPFNDDQWTGDGLAHTRLEVIACGTLFGTVHWSASSAEALLPLNRVWPNARLR